VLPVNFDAVMRLTYERNARIARAREQVREAEIIYRAACDSCLPNVFRQEAYRPAEAEAKLWEQRAVLARTEIEVLEDAANTYFDWLGALAGQQEGPRLREYDQGAIDLAQELDKLAAALKPDKKGDRRKGGVAAEVAVQTVKAQLMGHENLISGLQRGGVGYAARLAYLLDMGDTMLVPADPATWRFELADPSPPVEELVAQALANGPGVHELEGLVNSLQSSLARAQAARWLCDCTGSAMICGRLHAAESKLQQAGLALADTRGKLRAGVTEARSTILIGRQRLAQTKTGIGFAENIYRAKARNLTNKLAEEAKDKDKLAEGAKDTATQLAFNEMLLSIQGVASAHTAYLSSLNQYHKAQVRLLLYLGAYRGCPPPAPGVATTTLR
jgi:hypothetical protein